MIVVTSGIAFSILDHFHANTSRLEWSGNRWLLHAGLMREWKLLLVLQWLGRITRCVLVLTVLRV